MSDIPDHSRVRTVLDDVADANDARYVEWLETRGTGVSEIHGVQVRHLLKKDTSVEKMRECIKLAALHRHGVTGIDADALAATIDIGPVLAAEFPMLALEDALTAGEAKIRSEAQ